MNLWNFVYIPFFILISCGSGGLSILNYQPNAESLNGVWKPVDSTMPGYFVISNGRFKYSDVAFVNDRGQSRLQSGDHNFVCQAMPAGWGFFINEHAFRFYQKGDEVYIWQHNGLEEMAVFRKAKG